MLRHLHFLVYRVRYLFKTMLWLWVLLFPASGYAQQEFSGQWYAVNDNWQFSDPLNNPVESVSLTGGHFVFQSALKVTDDNSSIVIDFKNASALGRFHHTISDTSGKVIAEAWLQQCSGLGC